MSLFILPLLLLLIPLIHCQWSQVMVPNKYLGDTPYQNQSFQSTNITTALRIQRDIASNVTLDYWLWPALSLSTAYFRNDYSARKLGQIDQLLLMGYRRLILDIYWNQGNWRLCPLQNGTCEASLDNFMELINDYLVATDNSISSKDTNIISIEFNLHQLDNSTVQTTSQLGYIVSNRISKTTNFLPRIYTPLNLSQYIAAIDIDEGNHSNAAITNAFQRTSTSGEIWPHWIYLIQREVQLLVSIGDNYLPVNSSYQLSALDQQVLFPSNDIANVSHSALQTKQTCAKNATINPWSFVGDNEVMFTYETAHQAVECGSSPLFTHSNYSDSYTLYSAVDSGHLADNILSTIWSWDINEPKHASEAMDLFCAAMQRTNGRWRSYSCETPLRVACRFIDDPYKWIITEESYNYDGAAGACPEDYVFDVPRIALQNTLLYNTFLMDNEDTLIWINLNLGFPAQDCWVIGEYGSCWWLNQSGEEFLGLIRTSIGAGVIILIIVTVFTWVKCARLWRNRNSKARKSMAKRMIARREYVTVPDS
ncbi:hypothetical protein K501DRAFT_332391 [Backusella circina FSU 941]|nr:hypothetical protein K501DRAFT_332391 [Backusella circina FSU 941]